MCLSSPSFIFANNDVTSANNDRQRVGFKKNNEADTSLGSTLNSKKPSKRPTKNPTLTRKFRKVNIGLIVFAD